MDKQGGAEVLRFELRVKGGKLVNAEAEPIRLKEGAAATLYVSADALAPPKVHGKTVELLPEGEALLANVNPHPRDSALLAGLVRVDSSKLEGNGRGGWVKIVLEEPLKLDPGKRKFGQLQDVRCTIPALSMAARSVNHAYKLIRDHFEPGDRSSTGSVYLQVYYHDASRGPMAPAGGLARVGTFREEGLSGPSE